MLIKHNSIYLAGILIIAHLITTSCSFKTTTRPTGRVKTEESKLGRRYIFKQLNKPSFEDPFIHILHGSIEEIQKTPKTEYEERKKIWPSLYTILGAGITYGSITILRSGLTGVCNEESPTYDSGKCLAAIAAVFGVLSGPVLIFFPQNVTTTTYSEGQNQIVKLDNTFSPAVKEPISITIGSEHGYFKKTTDAEGQFSIDITPFTKLIPKGSPITFYFIGKNQSEGKIFISSNFIDDYRDSLTTLLPPRLSISASFDDSKTWFPNQILDASETADIVLEIANTGEGRALDVGLLLESDNQWTSIDRSLGSKNIGHIEPRSAISIRVPIIANDEMPNGEVTITIKATERRGYNARTIKLVMPARHLDKPALVIDSYDLYDGTLGLAVGNGNDLVENGEIIELRSSLKNIGPGTAYGTEIILDSISTDIEVLAGNALLGDIFPNQVKDSQLSFRVLRTFSADQLHFNLFVRDKIGVGTLRRSFSEPVYARTPKLAWSWSVLDSTGKKLRDSSAEKHSKLTNGANYELQIIPRNIGKITATDVVLQLAANPANFVSLSKNTFDDIGHIKAESQSSILRTNFIVHREFQGSFFDLHIQMRQSEFQGITDIIRIPIEARSPQLVVYVEKLNTSNRDDLIEQGENVEISFKIRNNGKLAADSVRISLELEHQYIDFYETEKLVGSIPPDSTETEKFSFYVRPAAVDTFQLLVKLRQSDKFPPIEEKFVYSIFEAQPIVSIVRGEEDENAKGFFPDTKQSSSIIDSQSSGLSDWLILSSTSNLINAQKVAIDGHMVDDFEIEKAGSAIRFRGTNDLKASLSNGLHTISVWLHNRIEQIHFWKEFKKLKMYESENFGKGYALIIGISKYGQGFRNLPEVEKQAKELGELLAANDFEVTYLLDIEHNVTLQAVEDAVSDLNKRMDTSKDRLFFYYGGHGKAVKPAFGDSIAYLILNNYDLNNLDNTCLSMEDIFSGKYMRQLKAKHILFAVDACVASIGRRMGEPDDSSIRKFMSLSLLYDLTKNPGRSIFTAGSGAQEAIDEEGKGGIFTTALINALRGEADLYYGDGNGVTILNELETYLRAHVSSAARMRRWAQEPARYDFGNGQFIFYRTAHN